MLENVEISNVEIISPIDGDVIAVYVKGYHSQEALEFMKKEIRTSFLPKIVKVIIINAELVDIKVMRVNE